MCEAPEFYDANLTEKGMKQARKAREKYQDVIARCDLVICSPFTRAIETMKIVFEGSECPVIITPLIAERTDTTCDIGLPLSQLRALHPNYEFMHFEDEYWWFCDKNNPKVLTKEPRDNVCRRALRFEDFLNSRKEKVIVVVTHGHFIRMFLRENLMLGNCSMKKAR
mmetsp:Transcript_25228/g.24837  ORF Transcript_25228/g.24837 Transcript_25228/m.24837 type:complete len:167 (+) Transcript_25228:82-582(+)